MSKTIEFNELRSLSEGDFWPAFVAAYRGYIATIVRNTLPAESFQDVEDVMQDVLLSLSRAKLFEKLLIRAFPEEGALKGYLATSAQRAAADHVTRSTCREFINVDLVEPSIAAHIRHHPLSGHDDEHSKLLTQATLALRPIEALAVNVERFSSEFGFVDELFQCKKGHLATLRHRAKKKLSVLVTRPSESPCVGLLHQHAGWETIHALAELARHNQPIAADFSDPPQPTRVGYAILHCYFAALDNLHHFRESRLSKHSLNAYSLSALSTAYSQILLEPAWYAFSLDMQQHVLDAAVGFFLEQCRQRPHEMSNEELQLCYLFDACRDWAQLDVFAAWCGVPPDDHAAHQELIRECVRTTLERSHPHLLDVAFPPTDM